MANISDNIASYLKKIFGETFLDSYKEYINTDPNIYLRISKTDSERNSIIAYLKKYSIELEAIANLPFAFAIKDGFENVGKTVEHALGKYYIQSLSSMIPPLILNPNKNDKTLDLCAAPGSKTTQLAAMMENKGTLIANEPNLQRVKSLVFNFDRMSFVNTGIIKNKGELLSKVYENYFDKVLVDAPCSALGIMQKKGEVSNWWNLAQAEKIAELQFKILLSALKMAKVGAEIVYSTCTMTIEENELVINKILKKYPVELLDIELPVKSNEGFTKFGSESLNPELHKTRRIVPWEINSEGFFIAKLRKIGETDPVKKELIKNKELNLVSHNNKKVKKYLENIKTHFEINDEVFYKYKYLVKNHDIFFVNDGWEIENLAPFTRVGIKMAKIDNKDKGHLYSNAASLFENEINRNIIELKNLDDLKIYLNGGNIKKEFQPFGQKVIKYNDYLIGAGVANADGLKSRFPRAMRTSEMIFPQ